MPNYKEKKSAEAINWISWQEAGKIVNDSTAVKKKFFVDVYTNWCGYCKLMDRTTFSDKKIAEYMNKNYYSIKFNAEMKEDVILDGVTYKYIAPGNGSSRGYHELAAALLNGKMGYPTVIFLDEQMNLLTPVPGYQETDIFEKIVTFFGDNHFKSTVWEEYQKNYVSKL